MTESNRIELKAKLTDSIEKEVIAFLNSHEGGIIYIGIDDKGKSLGVENSDEVQLKIKDRLKHNIQPSCLGLFDIVEEQYINKNILKIIIASGPEKPYYLKKQGMSEKGCFIRVGTAAEPMTVRLIESLFAKRTRNSIGRIKSNQQNLKFEQLGSGIPRILRSYPKESFQFSENFLRMTFNNEWNLSEEEFEIIPHDDPHDDPHDTPHDWKELSNSLKILLEVLTGEMTRKEIQDRLGLKDRKNFRTLYLQPAIELEIVEPAGTYNPKDRTQKYRLTDHGKTLLKQLKNESVR
ncbi:MAG: ATP-binding protein [Bacteroidetes bacterium]|nr:ATP-binding protein [Bacteroidota bacterium]